MSLLFEYLATLGGAGGGGSTTVVLADNAVMDINSGTAEASYSLTSAGDVIATDTLNGPTDIGDWISPKSGAPGSYECRADVVFGSVTGDSTGAWLALTSTRVWTLSRSTPGFQAARITVSIRLGGTTLTTATIDLTVQVSVAESGA